MAKYCKQCGCYLLDNSTTCLACGFDEATAKENVAQTANGAGRFSKKKSSYTSQSSSASGGYAFQEAPKAETDFGGGDSTGEYHGTAGNVEWKNNESWRKAADAKREQQQEWDRKWAEMEQRRRTMERQFQERQQAEAEAQGASRTGRTSYRSPGSTVRKTSDTTRSNAQSDDQTTDQKLRRIFTILSYISGMCFIPMIFFRDDEFAQFHAKQGLGLLVFAIAEHLLSFVPVLPTVMMLFRFYCIYKGMMSAINGTKEKLPIIGKYIK